VARLPLGQRVNRLERDLIGVAIHPQVEELMAGWPEQPAE
jgi:hypothetical protein